MLKRILPMLFFSLLTIHGTANALVIGIFDGQSPVNSAAIATHLNNNGFTATNFGAADINAGNLGGLDVAILLRASGNNDLVNFISGGGNLVTEWTSFDWAVNAGLLDATLAGGGFVASPDSVTFNAAGLAMGLGNGLPNPYADDGRTDYFRNVSSVGIGTEILATRSSGDAAILGANFGSGYVLGNMYDWGDWGESPANLDLTKQLLLNMVGIQSAQVPEPSILALLSLGLLGTGAARKLKKD